tara:strand:- start:445 stop:906 length:462 start_codon:yes stop_codon:yes gene_type:complete
MLKKILIIILFLYTSSCGYEAMHSKKNNINYNFSINKITLLGDRDVNQKIKEKLNIYRLNKEAKNLDIQIESISEKNILVKNSKGNATSFQNIIKIYVTVFNNNKKIDTFQFEDNFKYNNSKNKFDLNRYEKELKANLAESIVNKIIIRLSTI